MTPNVIHIIADSLRFDRISANGYPEPTTPNLDHLIAGGTQYSNCFAHGCPTQFSLPTVFTSSLPLDHGGYDRGVLHRPVTLAERLQTAGYNCMGVSPSVHVNSFFGYDRGFQQFLELGDVRFFWENMTRLYFTYYGELWQKAGANHDAIMETLATLLEAVLGFVAKAGSSLAPSWASFFSEPFLQPGFFRRHGDSVKQIVSRFQSDKEAFIQQFILPGAPRHFYQFLDRCNVFAPAFSERFHDAWFDYQRGLNARWGYNPWFRPNCHGRSVTNAGLKFIAESTGPYYLFLHYLDIHDRRTQLLTPCIDSLHRRICVDRLRKGSEYFGDIYYDLSVNLWDHELGRIVDYLKQRGELENTIIIVHSDHGKNSGAPNRGIGSTAGAFYDEFVHVPMILYGADIPKGKDNAELCGLINMAPTILDLLSLPVPDDFRGRSLFADQGDEHVLMEHAGRGPCDMAGRRLHISVRNRDAKLVAFENDDGSLNPRQFFDLTTDAEERHDCLGEPKLRARQAALEELATKRLKEIREQSPYGARVEPARTGQAVQTRARAATNGRIVVLVTRDGLRQRDVDRLGIPAYQARGFAVDVWNVSGCMVRDRKRTLGEESAINVVELNGPGDLLARVKEAVTSTTFLVDISLSYRSRRIFRILSTCGASYAVFNSGTLPWPSPKPQPATQRLRSWFSRRRSYSQICRPVWWADRLEPKVLSFLIRRCGYIAPPSYAVVSCTADIPHLLRQYPRLAAERYRLLYGGNADYATYRACQGAKALLTEPYAVFLDENAPLHPDALAHYGFKMDATAYYQKMRHFFDQFEAAHGLNVKIAAHPTAEYSDADQCFGGREVFRGQTALLVRDATAVLAHCSTSINFAVLGRKPLLLMNLDAYANTIWEALIYSFAAILRCQVAHTEQGYGESGDQAFTVEQMAYERYEADYIKPTAAENDQTGPDVFMAALDKRQSESLRKAGDATAVANDKLRVVDIGASGGIHPRWSSLGEHVQAVMFEPDDEAYKRLQATKHPDHEILNIAVSESAGEVPFYVCRKRESSSILKPNEAFIRRFPDARRYDVEHVTTIRTDSLDHQLGERGLLDVDFLKIDTQGHELSILRGGAETVAHCVGLELEVLFAPVYCEAVEFGELDAHVRGLGFELFDLKRVYWKRDGVFFRDREKGQLTVGDALYLRSPEAVMELPGINTSKVVRAAHVYRAFGYADLAMALLDLAMAEGMLSRDAYEGLRKPLFRQRRGQHLPEFRGRGRVAKLLAWLGNAVQNRGWAAGSDKGLGNSS